MSGPSVESLEECLDILGTGIALGLQTNALPGMVVYEATVTDRGERLDWSLGTFPDRDSALRALARWAVREWVEGWQEPWVNDPDNEERSPDGSALMDEWLQSRSLQDIIDQHQRQSDDILLVNEVTIQPALPGGRQPITFEELFGQGE